MATDIMARGMINSKAKQITALINDLKDSLGGVQFVFITKDDYNTMTEHDIHTVYFVQDNNNISMILGDTVLNSGVSPKAVALSATAQFAKIGVATEVNEVDYVTE